MANVNATPEKDLDPVQKWTMEMQAAERFTDEYLRAGRKVIERYVDDRKEESLPYPVSRLNLFHANTTTLLALMYAKLPKVEADRRFADPNDDVARVAGEMITRILQNDMNREDNNLATVLKHALWDRLVPGMGVARVKYCIEDSTEPVTEVEGEVVYGKQDEWCDEEYVHWRDFRYSPARTYEEIRWIAYRAYMSREAVEKRFGEDASKQVTYQSKGPALLLEGSTSIPVETEKQAEIWEIWDKDTKRVYWWTQGAQDLLDDKPDPLRLDSFFPSARPMAANTTTDRYIPKADFTIAQDVYSKIDQLETRISLLVDACKSVGVYAGDSEAVKNMLQEGVENQLIPVDNWAMLQEIGGIRNSIEWFPIQAVAETLTLLTTQQQVWIQKLYQVTGMSDIMRGQASSSGTTATEQKIKAQFGSVRISALQEEFATFASDLLNKKVQIIRNFYEPDRIVQLSNIMNTPDAQFAGPAIQLIKDADQFDMRIAVRSDSMAAVDLEQLKMDRTSFLQAMSQFIGQSMPLIQQMPESVPFLMQLMRFGLAGFKASSEMEGLVDQAMAKVEQDLAAKAAQPPQPSPEEKKMQMEGQMRQAELQMEGQSKQADFQMRQAESQSSAQLEQQKMQFELHIKQEEFKLEREKMLMEMEFKKQELALKQQEMQQKLMFEQAKASQSLAHQDRQFEQDAIIREEEAEQSAAIREDEASREESE